MPIVGFESYIHLKPEWKVICNNFQKDSKELKGLANTIYTIYLYINSIHLSNVTYVA